MRLLIAGGGTGGHIYPALAVARSLRARPDAAELAWLGGHRGLEATLVPPSGIPLRRLFLRSLRSAARDVHLVLDPIRLGLSIPQALVLLLARRPAAIFTTGGYVAIPTLLAAAVLRIPSVLWEGNVVPGRSVRFVAARATVLAVSYAETAAALGHPRAYVTGTPIRSLDGRRPRRGARARSAAGPGSGSCWCSAGSQAVRRINDAVTAALPRLVERVRVVHVTGDAGYAAALAAREALPEDLRDRYRPHAVPVRRRDDRGRSPRRTSPSGAPAPRPSPRPPRSRCRWRSCRTPTPPATSAATRSSTPRPARRSWSRTRTSTPTGWWRSRACSPTRPRTPRCRPPRATWPGRTPPTRSRTSCSRSRTARRCPSQEEIEAVARGRRG